MRNSTITADGKVESVLLLCRVSLQVAHRLLHFGEGRQTVDPTQEEKVGEEGKKTLFWYHADEGRKKTKRSSAEKDAVEEHRIRAS